MTSAVWPRRVELPAGHAPEPCRIVRRRSSRRRCRQDRSGPRSTRRRDRVARAIAECARCSTPCDESDAVSSDREAATVRAERQVVRELILAEPKLPNERAPPARPTRLLVRPESRPTSRPASRRVTRQRSGSRLGSPNAGSRFPLPTSQITTGSRASKSPMVTTLFPSGLKTAVIDPVRIAAQTPDEPARRQRPHTRGAVGQLRRTPIARRHREAAVGADVDVRDRRRVAAQRGDEPAASEGHTRPRRSWWTVTA